MNTFLIILCALAPFTFFLLILIISDLTDLTGMYNFIIKKPTKRQCRNREKEAETAKSIIEEYIQMSTPTLKKELCSLKKSFNDISSKHHEMHIHGTDNKYSVMYALSNMYDIGWRMGRIREILKSRKITSC